MMSQDPKETLLYPPPASTGKRLSDPAPQKLEIRKLFLRFCVLLRRERPRQLPLPDQATVSLTVPAQPGIIFSGCLATVYHVCPSGARAEL